MCLLTDAVLPWPTGAAEKDEDTGDLGAWSCELEAGGGGGGGGAGAAVA